MVEAMAKGTLAGEKLLAHDARGIKMVSRMAAELGADLVKTYYTGSIDSFREVVEACPVPIVILGGAKTDSLETVFTEIHDSIQAGGKGIAIGRNIWEHDNLSGMLKAVHGLVHGNWSVSQALSVLKA